METIYATFSLISQGLCSILNCKNVDFNDIYRLFLSFTMAVSHLHEQSPAMSS